MISQYTLDGEFIKDWKSLKQIKDKTGIDNGNVSRCVNGKAKSASGFLWRKKKAVKQKDPIRPVKTVKIYDKQSTKVKKNWLTGKQVIIAFFKKLNSKEHLLKMRMSGEVRFTEMAIQSPEYKYHLKNFKDDFYGIKYVFDQFYYLPDVVDYIKLHRNKKYWWPVLQMKADALKDLRSFLNDKRYLEETETNVPIKFYGDKLPGIVDRGVTMRIYYGLFFMRSYINQQFVRGTKYTELYVDLLIYLYTWKFFRRKDLRNYWRNYRAGGSKGLYSLWGQLIDDGYIERVNMGDVSPYHKFDPSEQLFKCTPKAANIVELYMDYILFRKKIPHSGNQRSELGLIYWDIKLNGKEAPSEQDSKHYMFYEHIYQWVNYNAEIKYTDDAMFDFLKKTSSSDFAYNPFISKIAEKDYIRTGNVNTNKAYERRFLDKARFGVSID